MARESTAVVSYKFLSGRVARKLTPLAFSLDFSLLYANFVPDSTVTGPVPIRSYARLFYGYGSQPQFRDVHGCLTVPNLRHPCSIVPPRQTRRRALETEYRMMCDFFFRERVPWRACRYCHRWHVSRRTRLYCGSTGCHFNKMRSYANTRLGSVNGSPYNNRFRF